MRRRRQVRVAHTEVDNIGAGVACSRLGFIDHLEDIGRQAADAVKLFHRLTCSSGAGLAFNAIMGCRLANLYHGSRLAPPRPAAWPPARNDGPRHTSYIKL